MKQTVYVVSHEQREQVVSRFRAELERESAVLFAYLYGSVLESDQVHDIDVGLYLDERNRSHGAVIASSLSAKLTAEVGIPVDVRVMDEAPLSLQYHVLRGQLLFYRDEVYLTETIEDIARRYLDLAPLLRQGTKDAFAA